MTTQLEQAARLALEALERGETKLRYEALTALRAALEQPAQDEPVVRWICKGCGHEYMEAPSSCDCMESTEYERIEYYTRPQAQPAQDEDVDLEGLETRRLYISPQQPAQDEPVAWLHPANATCVTTNPTAYARGIPLYTRPQAREPLTNEQWQVMADTLDCFITRGQKDIIEAALGIGEKK